MPKYVVMRYEGAATWIDSVHVEAETPIEAAEKACGTKLSDRGNAGRLRATVKEVAYPTTIGASFFAPVE